MVLPQKIVIFGFRGSSVLAGKHFPALRQQNVVFSSIFPLSGLISMVFLVKMVVFGLWEPKNTKFLQFGALSGLTPRGSPWPERVFWEAFGREMACFYHRK